jgi:hypothetical protein
MNNNRFLKIDFGEKHNTKIPGITSEWLGEVVKLDFSEPERRRHCLRERTIRYRSINNNINIYARAQSGHDYVILLIR